MFNWIGFAKKDRRVSSSQSTQFDNLRTVDMIYFSRTWVMTVRHSNEDPFPGSFATSGLLKFVGNILREHVNNIETHNSNRFIIHTATH